MSAAKPDMKNRAGDRLAGVGGSLAPHHAASARVVAFDRAYDEFLSLLEAGEQPDLDAFCARFPSFRSSLQRILQAHLVLDEQARVKESKGRLVQLKPGETYLGFTLLGELGRGAFARVFLAIEPILGGRLVAVKISQLGTKEAEILGRLQHPNIVPVYSVQQDEDASLAVVCMPYLGSATLGDVLDLVLAEARVPSRAGVILEAVQESPLSAELPTAGQLPPALLQRGTYCDGVRLLAVQLADALAFIHERGICHRDLKPSNVLMSPTGTPMLLDFNLSTKGEDVNQRLGGTLAYMPPEQLLATDKDRPFDPSLLDERADLFSLGVILYEMLAGSHPFGPLPLKLSSQEARKQLLAHQRIGPQPLRQANPEVDRSLARLVESCLAYNPEHRPSSAARLTAELRKGLGLLPRLRRWVRRHPWTVCGAGFMMFLAVFSGLLWQSLRPPYSIRQYREGVDAYRQGRYTEAVQHLNLALEADGNLTEAMVVRGRARQQLAAGDGGSFNLALDDFQDADKRMSDGRIKACLGYCLNRMGQHRTAIDRYQKAIQAEFAPAEVYNNLGFSYLALNELEDARKNLDQALLVSPDLQAALHNRALVCYRQTFLGLQELELLHVQGRKGRDARSVEEEEEKLRNMMGRFLETGMADIRHALRQDPLNSELLYDAARLHALAATRDPRLASSALLYLSEAVAQGANPRQLELDRTFIPLRKEALFKDLVQRPIPRQTARKALRFVDPVTDLPR
jgi:eukaryotic-like serine/threonine-protein kinase